MGSGPPLGSGLSGDVGVAAWRSCVNGMVSAVPDESRPARGAWCGMDGEELKGIASVSQSHQLVGGQGQNAEHQVAHHLAVALARLVADPVLRARMGAAARLRAEAEFGLDAVIAQTLALYRMAAA